MMEERLPCLPGPLYRAVPPRSADDGRVPRFLDRTVRDGSPAFGQSDLNMSATNNQQARICIIEDDPIMRGMVVDYLEQHNMRAVSASGRQELVRHFAASEPDLRKRDVNRVVSREVVPQVPDPRQQDIVRIAV